MRSKFRWILLVAALAMVVGALPASADHKDFPSTRSMHALGHSVHRASFDVPVAERNVSSDLAFWGKVAFQGNYDGFRVINIAAPGNPKLISHPRCNGDQGDVAVWEDILIRTWNSPAPAGRSCDGEPVPVGFEGLHIWDVSNLRNPRLIGEVELSMRPLADRELQNGAIGCGSHTVTLVPDLDNDRLVLYSQTSIGAGDCAMWPFVTIVEVPLDDPGNASFVRDVDLHPAHHGHDTGVILGDVNLMATPGHEHINVFSIGPPRGGSYDDPLPLFQIQEEGVCNIPGDLDCNGSWHSAAFTWDGNVLVAGWEPGGGGQAECRADSPDVKKTMFFYDVSPGAQGEKLGEWVLERPQGPDENCTIHNYNVVPLRSGKYVVAAGHYQAGTWVVDFTDPANAHAIAWADPPSLGPGPFCSNTSPPGCQLGGAWSSYWYNGFIYESDITRGLAVYKASHRALAGELKLPHLNPQTQEFSLP